MCLLVLLLVSILVCGVQGILAQDITFPGGTGSKMIYNGSAGQIRHNESSLFITCGNNSSITKFPTLKETVSAKEVASSECIYPVAPMADTLNGLNIDPRVIEILSITDTSPEELPAGNYTIGLNLTKLTLNTQTTNGRDYFMNNPDFLEPLTNLKSLIITGNAQTALLPIPEKLSLESLELAQNVVVKNWGNCRYLKKLSLIMTLYYDEHSLTEWPSNCSQLNSLLLLGMSERVATSNGIISIFIASSMNLRSLTIKLSSLSRLPVEILSVAKYINYLNLMSNELKDDALLELPLLKNLSVLDLSDNKIMGFTLHDAMKQVPSLRTLILDNNSLLRLLCTSPIRLGNIAAQLSKLERLSLNEINITVDCFKDVSFRNLSYLSLSAEEKVKTLKLQDFPTTNSTKLIVDLRKRIVTRIAFEDLDYNTIKNGNYSAIWKRNDNLTVLLDDIDCDCENYWLSRSIRENSSIVSLPDLKCRNTGTGFTEEDLSMMDCNKRDYVIDDCIIKIIPEHGHFFKENGKSYSKLEIECHGIKETRIDFPIFDDRFKLVGVNISGNNIGSLNDFYFPSSVQWLDLRGNAISRLSENETKHLFNSNRSIWLSQNSIICDCESASMLDYLHNYNDQVMDFESIICIANGRPLSDVTSYEVCQIGQRVLYGILGVVIAVTLIVVAVLWCYRIHVKIYLYNQGWCIYCLSENDEDPDRPYDVFLSFAHGDFSYVTEQLLPKLESEPDCYKVCVHYRDWVVGDNIPLQIMRSVSLSKRTIIILSKNFVRSLWGLLEFRYAIASAVKKGRPRLLVLVLDDVLDETLDEELEGYLHYNTYLRCDDPWFWQKLRYALPHGSSRKINSTSRAMDTEL